MNISIIGMTERSRAHFRGCIGGFRRFFCPCGNRGIAFRREIIPKRLVYIVMVVISRRLAVSIGFLRGGHMDISVVAVADGSVGRVVVMVGRGRACFRSRICGF